VDELNAHLGMARTVVRDRDLEELFDRLQSRLFDLGAELAAPRAAQKTASAITAAEVTVLEGVIDLYQETLTPLRAFILPVGNELAAALHVARTVCRRAERRVVTLHRKEPVNPEVLRYLNRLSDLLFVLARVANARAMVPDVTWKQSGTPAPTRQSGGPPPTAGAPRRSHSA
jgi:cob(I)alamin adenosyltransferase